VITGAKMSRESRKRKALELVGHIFLSDSFSKRQNISDLCRSSSKYKSTIQELDKNVDFELDFKIRSDLTEYVKQWINTGLTPIFHAEQKLPNFIHECFFLREQDRKILSANEAVIPFIKIRPRHVIIDRPIIKNPWFGFNENNSAFHLVEQEHAKFDLQVGGMGHGSASFTIASSADNAPPAQYMPWIAAFTYHCEQSENEENRHVARIRMAWVFMGFLIAKPNRFDGMTQAEAANFRKWIQPLLQKDTDPPRPNPMQ
jgi:hypothetical protein